MAALLITVMIRVESYTFFGAAGAHSTQAGIKKFSCEIESRKLSSGGGSTKISYEKHRTTGGPRAVVGVGLRVRHRGEASSCSRIAQPSTNSTNYYIPAWFATPRKRETQRIVSAWVLVGIGGWERKK